MARITDPRDQRRRHRAPEVDHLAAAVRLDLSLQQMRARDVAAGSPARPDDEPPTGLIDLNAIRALLGQPTTADVDPAAAAWLAGGADPDAARVVERVDRLDYGTGQAEPVFGELYDPEPTSLREHVEQQRAALDLTAAELAEVTPPAPEYTCEVLGNAFHTSPCGPLQHPAVTLEVPPTQADVEAPAAAERAQTVTLQPPPTDTLAAWERYVAEPKVDPLLAQAAPMLARELADSGTVRPGTGDVLAQGAVPGADLLRPGWRSRHDPRSLSFGVRRQLEAAPLADRMWWPGTVGDQGTEGACVGWGIVDAINARAAGDVDLTAAAAEALYTRARQLDDVPGEDYSGTSVLAGLKAAVEHGWIGSYSWCFGTRDVAQAVLQRGPVVVGVPWLSGMYDTGPGGLVQLAGDDTGAGHCLAVVGILLRGPQGQPGPYFVWQNSWGPSYGDGGLGYIHHRDLATLLRGVGEAAVPSV